MTRRRVNLTISGEEYADVCRHTREMGFTSPASFAAAALRGVLHTLSEPCGPTPDRRERPTLAGEIGEMFDEYSETERNRRHGKGR